MQQTYKVKLTHMLDNGDKFEFESFGSAQGHDDAVNLTTNRLRAAITELASATAIEIDKTKVELGAHKH